VYEIAYKIVLYCIVNSAAGQTARVVAQGVDDMSGHVLPTIISHLFQMEHHPDIRCITAASLSVDRGSYRSPEVYDIVYEIVYQIVYDIGIVYTSLDWYFRI